MRHCKQIPIQGVRDFDYPVEYNGQEVTLELLLMVKCICAVVDVRRRGSGPSSKRTGRAHARRSRARAALPPASGAAGGEAAAGKGGRGRAAGGHAAGRT